MVEEVESTSLRKDDYEDWDHALSNTENSVTFQQNDEENAPTFGNVSVTNSKDVHFGNKTFYQGPVTIQQFVYANGEEKLKKISESDDTDLGDIRKKFKTGIDNLACDTDAVIKNRFKNGDSDVNGSVNADSLKEDKGNESPLRGHPLKEIFSKYRVAVFLIVSFLSILLGVILIILLFLKANNVIENGVLSLPQPSSKGDEHDHNTPIKAPTDPVSSLQPLKLKIVTRLEWLAQPPAHEIDPLKTPVPYVIISHTATENCSSQAQCVFHVRYIQTFHMESRGWWDIGYNFLVGGDGEVYYGRGWDKEGSHTYGYNKQSIGISFIGTFISSKPPEYQLIACKNLIAKGVELGYIREDYKLLGARQLQTTQSPGNALFEEIKKWPHWVEKLGEN